MENDRFVDQHFTEPHHAHLTSKPIFFCTENPLLSSWPAAPPTKKTARWVLGVGPGNFMDPL